MPNQMAYFSFYIQLYRIYNMNRFTNFIIILFILSNSIAQAFVLKLDRQQVTRCYKAEVSTDKTLHARLGILRAEQRACSMRFVVSIKDAQDNTIEIVYDNIDRCQQSRMKQAYTFKHTLHDDKQDIAERASSYQICVEVIENLNEQVLAEIFIGEMLNYNVYDSDSNIPLVESHQYIEVDIVTQNIKRSLAKSAIHAKTIRQKGAQLDVKISAIMSKNVSVTLVQIVFLITFGVLWLFLVSKLKRKQ